MFNTSHSHSNNNDNNLILACRLVPDRCALANHFCNLGYKMNYNDSRILQTERNYSKRLSSKMAFISQCDSCLNKKNIVCHHS